MRISPRSYQRDGLDAIISELREKVSTLADMATGTGKTYFIAWLCMLLGGRILVVVHRDTLKRQAIQKVLRVSPEIGISVEQGEHRGDRRTERTLFDDRGSQIVVASKDTLSRPNRLRRYRRDDFDFVIIDEAHRAVKKNESYAAIVRYFCRGPIGQGSAKLVGLSASLDRLDKEALGGMFQSVAYRYLLPQAIADGYLLEPKLKRVLVKNISLSQLPTSRNPDGEREISQTALDRIMRNREYAYGIAKPLLEVAGNHRKAAVFVSSVPAAEIQAKVLNAEKPGSTVLCLGEPWQSAEEQLAALDRIRGDAQFIVTCDVLTEGWDYDQIEIVVPKPSRSRQRVAQMVGRGTRPLDGCVDVWDTAEDRLRAIALSPKPWCTVLDPCGVSEEHSLVNVTDIFTGRYTAALSKPVEKKPPVTRPTDTDDRRALRNALAAIEEEKLAGLRVDVEYELLDTEMMSEPSRKAGAVSRAHLEHPATEPQCAWLEGRGMRVPPGMTKREASAAINSLKAREDAGSATEPQKKLLARLGFNTVLTKGEARAVLDGYYKRLEDEAKEPESQTTA